MKDFVNVNGESLEVDMVVDSLTPGLMSNADKDKLDGIEHSANAYTHPTSHPPTIITQDTTNRFVTDAQITAWNNKASTAIVTTTANGLMSAADKVKLDGIASSANNYTHPTTHPPTIIAQNTTNRFVTDAQITTWNGKAAGSHNHSADNITSGILPISRGGTGTTSADGIVSAIGLSNVGIACCARSSGSNVTLPADIITKVTLNSFDVRTLTSAFEISNGGVKVNRSGTVFVIGNVYINLTSTATAAGCYVSKGNTELISQYILQYASGAMSSGGRIINVTAGDILYLQARANTTTTFAPGAATTYLSITYLK